jgi:hypothetical protein
VLIACITKQRGQRGDGVCKLQSVRLEMDVEAAPTEPSAKRIGMANQPPIVLFLR